MYTWLSDIMDRKNSESHDGDDRFVIIYNIIIIIIKYLLLILFILLLWYDDVRLCQQYTA